MIVAIPPPAAGDVTVVSVQGQRVTSVTGAGGATVLTATGSGVVRVAIIRPPGVAAPGPVRLRVRRATRVRWLARDIAGAPSGRTGTCRRFAHGARRVHGPALGADSRTLMRGVCRLLLRVGDQRPFTAQTGIAASDEPEPEPDPEPTPTPAPSAAPEPTPTPEPLPHRTGTQLFEYSIHIARNPLAAGDDELVVTNGGEDDHELAVRDAGGVLLAQTGNLPPRSDPASLALNLAPGDYTLYCPLPEHEPLGMKATLTVQ